MKVPTRELRVAIFALLGVGLALLSSLLPFAIWNLKGYIDTIPKELEEAALIDGASWPRVLWSVVAPMSIPATMTVVVMTFLNNWNEFIMAYTYLATDDLRTLAVISGRSARSAGGAKRTTTT